MEFLDLDLNSPPGAALLAAVRERHGTAMAQAAALPSRLFLLRSPWAPGLRFVGGQAPAPDGGVLSLAGSGETIEDALVSCLGEAVERLSQVEQPGDVTARAVSEALAETLPAARQPIASLLQAAATHIATKADWVAARALAGGAAVLVPADWCLRRSASGVLRDPLAALSTGAGAGASPTAAAARALLELVERDAASLWWIGGRRGRPLAVDGPAMAEAVRLLAVLRQGGAARPTWLLDITGDLGIASVAALSVAEDGRGLACGLAARLSAAEAARAALLELAQIELGLQIAITRRREQGETGLGEVDRRHLARAALIDAQTCELLHPMGAPLTHAEPGPLPAEAQLAALTEAFARRGIEAALVELTRARHGIAVVKAVAPELQALPSAFLTRRLRAAITATGGGGRWTAGASLV